MYSLEKVKDIARRKENLVLSKRVTNYMNDRYREFGKPLDVAQSICLNAKDLGFHKTFELKNRPGTKADIYYVEWEGETWYLKFFVESGRAKIVIWSCKQDGDLC